MWGSRSWVNSVEERTGEDSLQAWSLLGSRAAEQRRRPAKPWESRQGRACYDHAIIFISTPETAEIGLNSTRTEIFDSAFNWLNQISLADKNFQSICGNKFISPIILSRRISWLNTPFES